MNGIRLSRGEKIGQVIIVLILAFLSLIFLYPVIYSFSNSISDSLKVASREIFLLPKGFTLDAYSFILEKPALWQSYYNTVWYTVVGTAINIFLTMTFAYPISRPRFVFKKQLTLMMAFTMWFNGGMIPNFILVKTLGLYNTRWAIVLTGAILAWNVIITKTFLQTTIHESLIESAKLEGANDLFIFNRIVLPLSKPIIAVNLLFYAVGHWNQFFKSLIYTSKSELHPIQIYLRNVLFASQMLADAGGSETSAGLYLLSEKMKFAIIMFAMLPIMCVYPFLQKYFIQGVMIGSIKE